MSKLFEDEAKERQREHAGTSPGQSKTVTQKIGEVNESTKHEGEATTQASKVLGVNRQYLRSEDEARERQRQVGELHGRGQEKVSQKIDEANENVGRWCHGKCATRSIHENSK